MPICSSPTTRTKRVFRPMAEWLLKQTADVRVREVP